MELVQEFLETTECPFTWHISDLDTDHCVGFLENFKRRLDEKVEEIKLIKNSNESMKNMWPVQVLYAYELVCRDVNNIDDSVKVIDEAILAIKNADDDFFKKYHNAALHIVYSTKAFLLMKKSPDENVEDLIAEIIPFKVMQSHEKSLIYAIKAQMLRYYGIQGTRESLSLLRMAIAHNPEEPEWKYSLVVSLNRTRHYFRESSSSWESVEEVINILEELLNHPSFSLDRKTAAKYYLAVAYFDFAMGKYTPEAKECRMQVNKLCNDICDLTNNPHKLSFCADRLINSNTHGDKEKGKQILKDCLLKFPTDVTVNTIACKLYMRENEFASAAKCAQLALDSGGYGAAWLLLECKIKLNQYFDEDSFFSKILCLFSDAFKKKTYLGAFLYYAFVKRNMVKAAVQIRMALIEDPSYDGLHSTFCSYVKCVVNPLEVAYNQICRTLKKIQFKEDYETLCDVLAKIEKIVDVKRFSTAKDLVEETWNGKPQPSSGTLSWRRGF